ncbi:MAG: hypothetical protein ABSG31_00255 [Tepidisphaeraceae bacterium]
MPPPPGAGTGVPPPGGGTLPLFELSGGVTGGAIGGLPFPLPPAAGIGGLAPGSRVTGTTVGLTETGGRGAVGFAGAVPVGGVVPGGVTRDISISS